MCVAFILGRFTQGGGRRGGGGEGGVINLQTAAQTKEDNSVLLLEDNMIQFHWFNDDLIPSKTVLDMNIGTNYDPFGPQDD